jgi:hypothetical protein
MRRGVRVLSSPSLEVEQRKAILPGLFLVRTVGFYYEQYDGEMASVGPNQIRVYFPNGFERSTGDIDHTYALKRHVYF